MSNKQSWMLLAGIIFFSGCDRGLTEPVKIECARYEDAILDEVRESVPRNCLPPHSTDIYVDYNPGGLLGGSRTFVRCKIDPESLRAFIRERKLEFRYDSTQCNANKKNKIDDFIGWWPKEDGKDLMGGAPNLEIDYWKGTYSDVTEYWSYNFIYTNNGGYRMFYDVKRQLFYAQWSSN
mgnify:CR=1 FL=1